MTNQLKRFMKNLRYLLWRWRIMDKVNDCLNRKEYGELLALSNKMISKNPRDLFGYYYRGIAHEALGLFNSAIKDFEQCETNLNRTKRRFFVKEYFPKVQIQISRVYKKLQNTSKAFQHADKAIEIDKSNINALIWRAGLKEDLEDYSGALEDLNKALVRKPKDETLIKSRNRLIYLVTEDKKEKASR